jgi:hypothetical protein
MQLTENGLIEIVTQERLVETEIAHRARQAGQILLKLSDHVRQENFTSIHPYDLETLFLTYDKLFFAGSLTKTLGSTPLRFRLSMRMTSNGGRTVRFRSRDGRSRYEITIACGLLFQGFSDDDRQVQVCGIPCENRLQALLRIFEHELVHLIEDLCWSESQCSASRFQNIAARLFGHRHHKHELITWKERAISSGIRLGTRVSFVFEGVRRHGHVHRVTKRATVLVEDGRGALYSDGRRYRKFYVPLAALEPGA